MEWKGVRFYKVNAESNRDANFDSMAVNLDINDLRFKGDELRVEFSYTVDYKPDIARMKFDGYALLAGSRSDLDKVEKEWKKDKTLPKSVGEPLINVISFNAQTNGVLVAKAINIVPPLMSPKLEMGAKA